VPILSRETDMALPRNLKIGADRKARLGGQLLRLAKRYDKELAERLAPFRLAPTHYEILKLLYAAPDYSLSNSRVAEALGVTLPSITLAVKKLSALRLVGSQRGEDRRERIVTLSVKGAEMLALLYDRYEQFAEDLFSAIDEKKAAALEQSVARLLSRLTEMQDREVASVPQ
jgi:DNA-binding MarR family transcriptional regulator